MSGPERRGKPSPQSDPSRRAERGHGQALLQQGARTADAVAAQTHAGTGCGSCRDALEGIVSWLGEQESVNA